MSSYFTTIRTVLSLAALVGLALVTASTCAAAQSNPAGNLPILDIDGMFPSQRNKAAVQLLYKNEGKIIYLNGIDLEFQYMSPYSDILRNCYNAGADGVDYSRLEGTRIAIPEPQVSDTTDEKTYDNGIAYKNHVCEHYVTFTMRDKRRVPKSSAGTGMETVIIRKPFLVSLTKSGFMKTFNLREMAVSATNSPSTMTPPSAASPQQPAAPKASSGTAFRITNGQFVTNYHVINGCTALQVAGNPGGRVVFSDVIKDLAIVSIANDSGPIASIRTTRPQLNEAVTAAGFPLDGLFSGISVTNGTVSRLSGIQGDTGTLQMSAPIQPGNSGGPLLDAAGNVIGVVSSRLDALKMVGAGSGIPQNVNFAISGNVLRGFLDAKNVNYKEVTNERELPGVQIAARASAFTVLIECQR